LPSISKALRHAFQHDHSNTPRCGARNPQKSAIPPSPHDRGRTADRAPGRQAENPKSFAAPPPHHTAGQHLARIDRAPVQRGAISARQNIPGAGARSAYRATARRQLQLQLRCN